MLQSKLTFDEVSVSLPYEEIVRRCHVERATHPPLRWKCGEDQGAWNYDSLPLTILQHWRKTSYVRSGMHNIRPSGQMWTAEGFHFALKVQNFVYSAYLLGKNTLWMSKNKSFWSFDGKKDFLSHNKISVVRPCVIDDDYRRWKLSVQSTTQYLCAPTNLDCFKGRPKMTFHNFGQFLTPLRPSSHILLKRLKQASQNHWPLPSRNVTSFMDTP